MPCTLEEAQVIFKALSNEHRLQIMGWLMNPTEAFDEEPDGDRLRDGVSVSALTEKTGLTQPSVSNHMHILQQAGLVSSRRIKNWVFYRAEPARFRQVIAALEKLAAQAPDRKHAA